MLTPEEQKTLTAKVEGLRPLIEAAAAPKKVWMVVCTQDYVGETAMYAFSTYEKAAAWVEDANKHATEGREYKVEDFIVHD